MVQQPRWMAGLIALSLTLGSIPVALASTTEEEQVASRMNRLGIVQGVGVLPSGQTNFDLDGPITRAQLVTTIVRSFGLETAAKASAGLPSFADVPATEWFSGYVAVAKNLAASKGIAIGRSETVFDPNASVSKVEALIFVMKFLGYAAEGPLPNQQWYEPWLNRAEQLGLLTPAQRSSYLADPMGAADRGEAFVILDLGYKAAVLPGGLSLYTQYVDAVAPVLTVLAPPATTTTSSITLNGSVSDNKGVASLTFNGDPVTLNGNSFSQTVPLNLGPNALLLVATDLAGNVQTQTVAVNRTGATAASIQVADLIVGAGQTVPLDVKVLDASGTQIPGVAVIGTSTLGTFANGQFIAAGTLGTGQLTLQAGTVTKQVNVTVQPGPVAKIAPAVSGPGVPVKLQALDAFSNAITTGVTWQVAPGQINASLSADGTFTGLIAGKYTVFAVQNGTTMMGQVGVYGMVSKLGIEVPNTVVGNGEMKYEVKVTALDSNGFPNPTYTGNVTLTGPLGTYGPVAAQAGVATFTVTASDTLVGERITLTGTGTLGTGTVTGTAQVDVVAQVASGIRVKPAAAYLTSNSTSTMLPVNIDVVDQTGAPMLEGEYELSLSLAGPALFSDGRATKSLLWTPFSGTVQIEASEIGASGTVTLTVTGSGLTAGSAQIAARMAQSPKLIALTASGTQMTARTGSHTDSGALYFSAFLTDVNGVPVTTDDKNLKVVFSGIANAELERHFIAFDEDGDRVLDGGESFVPLDLAALEFSAVPDGTLNFWIVGEKAGQFGVSVVEDLVTPTLTPSKSLSYGISAKGAHHFEGVHAQGIIVRRGDVTPLRYQVVDSFGNAVAQSGLSLVFDPTGTTGLKLNGTTTAVTVKTDASGIAAVDLVAEAVITTPGGVPVSINPSATNTANGWSGTAVEWDTDVTALLLAPGSVEIKVEYDTGSEWAPLVGAQPVDTAIRVVATVKDNQGYNLPGLGTTIPVQLVVKSTGETFTALNSVSFSDPNGDGVYESSSILIRKAGAQTLQVELANMPQAVRSNTKSVSFRAGPLAGVKILQAVSGSIKMKENQPKDLTIQLVDAFGNLITSSSNPHAVRFSLMAGSGSGYYTSFRDQDGNELITSGITGAAGRTGANFSLRTNLVSGNSITVIATIDDDNSDTFGGSDTVYTVTYSIIPE